MTEMEYNKVYLSAALEDIRKKGDAKKREYETRRSLVAAANPRLAEIDSEIMKLGPMLGISALGGYGERVEALKKKSVSLAAERKEILQNSGIMPFEPVCGECNDTGYVGSKLCKCVLSRAKELSYKALCAEMPIAQCRFGNFDLRYYKAEEDKKVMEKILGFCLRYCQNLSIHSESLLFFGGTGLGKTHLSLAIAAEALEKGLGVVYSPAQNLLHKLEKEHFSYSAETPLLDDVFGCDLLILDDLGAEFSNSFSQSLIYNIINTRLLSGRPTIISTNLTVEELAEKYTPRVASRIMGCYNLKRFCGQDIRQQKRLEQMKRGN